MLNLIFSFDRMLAHMCLSKYNARIRGACAAGFEYETIKPIYVDIAFKQIARILLEQETSLRCKIYIFENLVLIINVFGNKNKKIKFVRFYV